MSTNLLRENLHTSQKICYNYYINKGNEISFKTHPQTRLQRGSHSEKGQNRRTTKLLITT